MNPTEPYSSVVLHISFSILRYVNDSFKCFIKLPEIDTLCSVVMRIVQFWFTG